MLLAAAPSPEPAVAIFAPPLDRPMRLVTEQIRDDGATQQRFTLSRRLIFRRTAHGFVAELTVLPAVPTKMADQRLLDRVMQTMADRPLRILLTSDGEITGIADQALVWQRFLMALETLAVASRDRDVVRSLATGMASMTPAQQRAFLASPLDELLAPRDAALAPTVSRPVAIPAGAPGSGRTMLSGEETVSIEDGRTRMVIRAHGDLPATGPLPARTAAIDRVRDVDRRTGLLLMRREDTETRFVIEGETILQTEHNIARLDDQVP